MGSNDLRTKYERAPIDTAKELLTHINILKDASSCPPVTQLTAYSGNSLNRLAGFLRDLQIVAKKAEQEEARAKRDIEDAGALTGFEDLSDAARDSMKALCEQLEKMEVYDDAVS